MLCGEINASALLSYMLFLKLAAFLVALYARNKLTQCYMFLSVAGANLLKAEAPRKLVTTGPFRRFKNPVYVWSAVMWLAGCILFSSTTGALFVVCVILPIQYIRARREGRVLRNAFPKEYEEWARKTWF